MKEVYYIFYANDIKENDPKYFIIKKYRKGKELDSISIKFHIKELIPHAEIAIGREYIMNDSIDLYILRATKGIITELKPINSSCNVEKYRYNIIRQLNIIYSEIVHNSQFFTDSILDFNENQLKNGDIVLIDNITTKCADIKRYHPKPILVYIK